MSQIFNREIDKLKKHLVCMFKMVENNYSLSVQVLSDFDSTMVARVFEAEEEIDAKRVDLQEECFKVLALHQPVAFDLRIIMATLKFNNDLERIADLAVGIADRSQALAALPKIEPPFDYQAMSGLIHSMLTKSLKALIGLDVVLAAEVLAIEKTVDIFHRKNIEQVKEEILRTPEHIDALISFLSISRYLERIADLATNLGEEVIYIVKGEQTRHLHHDEREPGE